MLIYMSGWKLELKEQLPGGKNAVFLEISKNSQEGTCARASFLIKLQIWAYFAKFLRIPFLTEHLGGWFWN